MYELYCLGVGFVVGIVIGILFGRKNKKRADMLAAAAAKAGSLAQQAVNKVKEK